MKRNLLLLILIFACNTAYMQTKQLRYLALGDSYTIGESVETNDNFPHQTVEMLRKQHIIFDPPTIVAKTGWTTDELEAAIAKQSLYAPYDVVTLLIGVNNQYRGRSVSEYETEFTRLLQTAIRFAGNEPRKVVVLSIPDWGVTPFAKDRDQNKIAKEIDAFNAANKRIAEEYQVHYIDITPLTREAAQNTNLVASDGLHPAAADYARWAKKLSEKVVEILNK